MRRSGGNFEITAKAPTLGLVTRIPSEQPDSRAATVASNVRFEKGTAANAPGYGRLTTVPVLDSEVNLIHQATLVAPGLGATTNVAIFGTKQKLWSLARYPAGTVNQPPVVSAGAYPPVPFDGDGHFTLTLAGTVTDDGLPFGILRKKWTVTTQPEGAVVTFADDTDPTTLVTFSIKGVYVLRLSASDLPSGGYQTISETTINVHNATYQVTKDLNTWNLPPGNGFSPGALGFSLTVWAITGANTRILIQTFSPSDLTAGGPSTVDFTAAFLSNATVIAQSGGYRSILFTLSKADQEYAVSGGWVDSDEIPSYFGLSDPGLLQLPVEASGAGFIINYPVDIFGPQVPFASGYDPNQVYSTFVPVYGGFLDYYRAFGGTWAIQQNKPATATININTHGAGGIISSSPSGVTISDIHGGGDVLHAYSYPGFPEGVVVLTLSTGPSTAIDRFYVNGVLTTPVTVTPPDELDGNGVYSYTFTLSADITFDYYSVPNDF